VLIEPQSAVSELSSTKAFKPRSKRVVAANAAL
jgi:hypothetical protein